MEKVWVFAGQLDGVPGSIVLELLTGARQFSDQVSVIGWGPSAADSSRILGEYGATILYDFGDLGESLPGPKVSRAIAKLINDAGAPRAVLFPAIYDARDVAGRLSVLLDQPVIANIVGMREGGGELLTEHAIFGGSTIVEARFVGQGVGLYLVRAKTFNAAPVGSEAARVTRVFLEDAGATDAVRIVEHHDEQQSGPALDEAQIIVSGGRGIETKDNYSLIEELASLLKGAAGASRAIVDAGWVPYSHQVGQTGTTVKPLVYIAVGISGASQHLAGMLGSSNIIAINRDSEAPIFSVADLGLVGDCTDILPRLIDELRNRIGVS